MNQTQNTDSWGKPSILAQEFIQMLKNGHSDEEIKEAVELNRARLGSPVWVDHYIYSVEHRNMKDAIVDWDGCNINESWEQYKEDVGYYQRHSQRKQESINFTKSIMNWWKNHCKRMGWNY